MWKGIAVYGLIVAFALVLPVGNAIGQSSQAAESGVIVTKAETPDEREARTAEPCAPPWDNRKSDLCAQWKAADAANSSAFWSFLTLIVTVISVYFLWRSLENERAVEKKNSRAYLGFDAGEVIKKDGQVERFTFKLVNYGRTAATNALVQGSFTLHMVDQRANWSGLENLKLTSEGAIIHPGMADKVIVLVHNRIGIDEWRRFMRGLMVFTVFVAVRYRDVYGEEHFTQSQFRLSSLGWHDGELEGSEFGNAMS